ncbi:MAG: hypothetical protein GQ571_13295 [Desulfobacterales bacterium]|jgi:glutaconate CoA-transferase subunit B|nr:hypothetical protein [Desulfobacterales bacterium]
MDFDEKTKHVSLKSIHLGVSADELVKNTGFEIIIPENIETNGEPSAEKLQIIRTLIDQRPDYENR